MGGDVRRHSRKSQEGKRIPAVPRRELHPAFRLDTMSTLTSRLRAARNAGRRLPWITRELGAWRPDLPPFRNPGLTGCTNAIPIEGGYISVNALSSVSDALNSRCLGAIPTIDTDGNILTFAATATK